MNIPLIGAQRVAALLPMSARIAAMATAMSAVSEGRLSMPSRGHSV